MSGSNRHRRDPMRIRIHDHLALVSQIDRIKLLELLPPLLHMLHINLVPLQKVGLSQMHQNRALGITNSHLHVVGIGHVDVA